MAVFKHILLATDGGEASAHAARLAVDMARALRARLTAVYVVDPYPYLGIGEANPMGLHAYLSAAREHAAAAQAQVVALCKEPGEPVDLQLRLVEDTAAAQGILATAAEEGADLIVTGAHGRRKLQTMLGSVSAKLAFLAPVPLLVAR